MIVGAPATLPPSYFRRAETITIVQDRNV